jgi:ribulose-5-phosphate 4-epimerase/fuculose-1-phosphate aldolase
MLRNHGLLTVGKTIADAFLSMYVFETACAIQVRAMAGGVPLRAIDPRIIDNAMEQARTVTKSQGGLLAWPALLRKLDRSDPRYKN